MLRVRSVMAGVPGTPWYSNLYFNGTTSADAQAAVDAVGAFWDGYSGVMSSLINIQIEEFVASLNPATGLPIGGFTTEPAQTYQGQAGLEMLPRATQALLQLSTGAYVGGRAIKGKVFLPALQEGANGGGGVPTAQIRGVLSDLGNAMATSAPQWVVWSRKNGAVFPVLTTTTAPEWAVLRSRRD